MPDYKHLVSEVRSLVNKYNRLLKENEKLKLMLATRNICPMCGGKVVITRSFANVLSEKGVKASNIILFECTKCDWSAAYTPEELEKLNKEYGGVVYD